jgi:hypothetical protein
MTFTGNAQGQNIVVWNKKIKGHNGIANINYGRLCLREENLRFKMNIYIIQECKFQ